MTDLPPLDQAQAYVVVGPNDQRGPYTMELLIDEVVAGRLSDSTPVWWPALTDWTTLAAHPGVAAEISRRRSVAAPAPEWANPTPVPPTPQTYAQPEPAYQEPQPAAAYEPVPASPYGAPVEAAPAVADPFASNAAPAAAAAVSAPIPAEQYAAEATAEPVVVDLEPVEADVVEVIEVVEVTEIVDDDSIVVAEIVEVAEVIEIDPAALAQYHAFVGRSSIRADAQARIDHVDEALVAAVVDAARASGFDLDDRVDVDRGHELRFGESGGDLLVLSLGRIGSIRPQDIRADHVPVTVSYRSGSYQGAIDAGDGTHGEVEVTADEWTGQATSSVSLFLGLEDYVGEDLQVNDSAVQRDLGAAIAVVRGRLR